MDVLARVENYVLTRIPEAIEVQIEDPSQLDGDLLLPSSPVCMIQHLHPFRGVGHGSLFSIFAIASSIHFCGTVSEVIN